MKQAYKEIRFNKATMQLIQFFDKLIADYQAQGFKLSVRQLYYQLVARDIVPNTEQSYKRVASILNDARLAGLIDWEAIEDRGRDVVVRGRWTSPAQIIRSSAQQFHMDMWTTQPNRVFVVVEKAALAGVLEGVCWKYDVPLLAARGYPSVSIVREMALEHIMPTIDCGQYPTILHLGDHDPSGIDMTRDITERMCMFAEEYVKVHRIALTMDQIEDKEPPPNPAKMTDARFEKYANEFGDESWELDALEPQYLVDLVTTHIEKQIDWTAWDKRKQEISKAKRRLEKTAEEYAAGD